MDAPSRTLALDGASNFRDLGGYLCAGGQRLRWRQLFRSDHLAALTARDKQLLAQLGLAHSIDLRGVAERAAMAYELPGVRQLPLPIEPTVVQRAKELAASGHTLTAEVAKALMQETYRAFVSDNTQQFAALFAQVLDNDAPLVFHCTAGKDRTGFAAALLLLALGASRHDVMQDYLLTNSLYQRPGGLASSAPEEALRVIWRVQEDFLQAAFELIETEYAGIENYLEKRLGVAPAARRKLCQLYLQPAAG